MMATFISEKRENKKWTKRIKTTLRTNDGWICTVESGVNFYVNGGEDYLRFRNLKMKNKITGYMNYKSWMCEDKSEDYLATHGLFCNRIEAILFHEGLSCHQVDIE